MALSPGTRLGHYDVTSLLGEGGMGEVWQARDTKLDRDVALKVLPEAFTADPDRLARFEREAKVLAWFNHPIVAAIGGPDETDASVRCMMRQSHLKSMTLTFALALWLPSVSGAQDTPRTPWGHPDLQGAWTNTTTTPLQRPDELAGREFLTEEEWAERNPTSGLSAFNAGPTGAYNDFWLEKGSLSMRTSLIIDPPDGKLPPATPALQARQDRRRAQAGARPASWHDFSAYDRCITRGLPGAMMPGFYNHNYRIVQTPHHVAILVEMVHEARIVPLDDAGQARPSDGRQWLGSSRGHWEGDTLVVETAGFTDNILGGGFTTYGVSAGGRVVERFTRVDADTLDYEVTVSDPSLWTDSWTVSMPMTSLDGELFEYACHEGNHAMGNMLAGARVEEAAEAGR